MTPELTGSPMVEESIAILQQKLAERDQVIPELALELVRLNQLNRSLQQCLLIAAENKALVPSTHDLSTREPHSLGQDNLKLQQYLRDLPHLYQRKFAERILPLKQQLGDLRAENQELSHHIQHFKDHFVEADTVQPWLTSQAQEESPA